MDRGGLQRGGIVLHAVGTRRRRRRHRRCCCCCCCCSFERHDSLFIDGRQPQAGRASVVEARGCRGHALAHLSESTAVVPPPPFSLVVETIDGNAGVYHVYTYTVLDRVGHRSWPAMLQERSTFATLDLCARPT